MVPRTRSRIKRGRFATNTLCFCTVLSAAVCSISGRSRKGKVQMRTRATKATRYLVLVLLEFANCPHHPALVPRKYLLLQKMGVSGNNAGHAAQLDGRQAIGSAEFLEHAVDMIFDRLLGEIQLGGDFLVGKSTADQLHQLLLTPGES
jgi:hypothetical protein